MISQPVACELHVSRALYRSYQRVGHLLKNHDIDKPRNVDSYMGHVFINNKPCSSLYGPKQWVNVYFTFQYPTLKVFYVLYAR